MLRLIGAAALKDSIGTLDSEREFFSKSVEERKTILSSKLPSYPAAFIDYLSSVSQEVFLSEVKAAIQIFAGFSRAKTSGLLEAMTLYISKDIGEALDELNSAFFFMPLGKRQEKLEALFPGSTILAKAVRELFSESTYQEITAKANAALSLIKQTPVIVIQTPLELSAKNRADIRTEFNTKHPGSFAEFQVNPQVIGGMRVFVNGEVADHSWLAKIQAITSM